MKLKSLELENWSSYRGSGHKIDFAQTPGSLVTVVYANNGLGKTSILKALGYVLYGQVNPPLHRASENYRIEDFPNRTELREFGKAKVSITLTFEHGDQEWRLTRQFVATGSGEGAPSISAVEKSLVRVGQGTGVSTETIDDWVNDNLVNRSVSHFYFFDGVLLEEIQSQLTKRDEASRSLVMRSIENALGLRFVDHLFENLQACLSHVDTKIAQQSKLENKNQQLQLEISALEDQLKSATSDLALLQVKYQSALDDKANCDSQLARVGPEARQKTLERAELEKQHVGLNARLENQRQRLRALGERSWLWPMAQSLASQTGELEQIVEKSKELSRQRASLESLISQTELSLKKRACATCGHSHTESELDSLLIRLDKARLELADLAIQEDDPKDDLISAMKFLQLANQGKQVVEAQGTIDELQLEIRSVERKIKSISDALGGAVDDIDVQWIETQRDDAIRRETQYSIAIEKQNEVCLGYQRELNTMRDKRSEVPGVSERERSVRKTLDLLSKAVESSFEGFRDEMRRQVEAKATENLALLTSEPEIYSNIKIDPNYRIRMTNPAGIELQASNAGHRQILTTAFVSAMAAVSTESTPFVMDTALAHLDPQNSQKMLAWARASNQQIVFLANPKELPKREADEILGSAIGRKYEIVRSGVESSDLKELR